MSVKEINVKQKIKITSRIKNSAKKFYEEESLKNKTAFQNNKCFSNTNSFIYIHKISYYSPGDTRLSKNGSLLLWWRKQI